MLNSFSCSIGLREIFTAIFLMSSFGSQMLKWFGVGIWKPKETKFFMDVADATIRSRRAKLGRVDNHHKDILDRMIDLMEVCGSHIFAS